MEKESMLLLREASQIEKTDFFKKYLLYIHRYRQTAINDCCRKRGDRSHEQGMVEAFDIVLGTDKRDSAFNALRNILSGKIGVASSNVPKKE